jgi:hypothetical protein
MSAVCSIERVMSAEILDPAPSLRARGGRHHGELGERADELDRDRADAASAADDENRGGRTHHRLADVHAVEQGFPCGDRCERQRRGLGKSERAWLVPDNTLVDEMKLGVGARADDAARIEDLVARPEERRLWARLDDDARRIVADHFRGPGRRRSAGAHLIVHRVHRNGANLDQKRVAHAVNSSRRALASFRSSVSKPSVNQP